eukprot:4124584-Ditylum_brightwellii.AAC.1
MAMFETYPHGVQWLAAVAVTFQLYYTSCSTADFSNKEAYFQHFQGSYRTSGIVGCGCILEWFYLNLVIG